jgi:hypothetical protein
MTIFHPGRHAAPETPGLPGADVISSEHLTGYPYLVDITEGPGGEVRGRLCLGTDEDGKEFLYTATDTEALTRLIHAADVLRRRMTRACGRTARRAVTGGAA